MTNAADLVSRLDRLESIEALRRVSAQYAHGADQRDMELFLAAFHVDATWDVGSARFVGHDQIRGAIEHQWKAQPEMHHWTTNLLVTLTGRHNASVASDVAVMTRLADGSYLLSSGAYRDTCERRRDAWALFERRGQVYSTTQLTESVAEGLLAESPLRPQRD